TDDDTHDDDTGDVSSDDIDDPDSDVGGKPGDEYDGGPSTNRMMTPTTTPTTNLTTTLMIPARLPSVDLNTNSSSQRRFVKVVLRSQGYALPDGPKLQAVTRRNMNIVRPPPATRW
ncbi:hypothetical protein HPB47_001574, partial [Ixodes persulcatus]